MDSPCPNNTGMLYDSYLYSILYPKMNPVHLPNCMTAEADVYGF